MSDKPGQLIITVGAQNNTDSGATCAGTNLKQLLLLLAVVAPKNSNT